MKVFVIFSLIVISLVGTAYAVTIGSSDSQDSSLQKILEDCKQTIGIVEDGYSLWSNQTHKITTGSCEIKKRTNSGFTIDRTVYPFMSPLKQIQSGISFNEIQCKQNLVLIQKYDGTPACVTESTKQKLIERGWTESQNKIEYQVLSEDKVLSKGTGFDLPKDTFTEDELRELEQHEKELRKTLATKDLSYEERDEIVNEINSMQERIHHPFQTGVPYHLVKMIKERYSVIDANFSELRKEVYFSGSSSQISHQYQALRIGIHPDHFSLPELKQQDQTIREYLGDEMNILYEKVLVVPSDEN